MRIASGERIGFRFGEGEVQAIVNRMIELFGEFRRAGRVGPRRHYAYAVEQHQDCRAVWCGPARAR